MKKIHYLYRLIILFSAYLIPLSGRSDPTMKVIIPSNPEYLCSGTQYDLFADIPYPDFYVYQESDWSIQSITGSATLTPYGDYHMNAHLTLNTPCTKVTIQVHYRVIGGDDGDIDGPFEAQHITANIISNGCIGSDYTLSGEIKPVSHVSNWEWTFPNGCLFNGNTSPYTPGTLSAVTSGTLSLTNNAVSGNIILGVTYGGCSDVGTSITQYLTVSSQTPAQPDPIQYRITGDPCPDNYWSVKVNSVQGAINYDWYQGSQYFLLDNYGVDSSELIIKHGAYSQGTTVYVKAWNGCGYGPTRSRSFQSLSQQQCMKRGEISDITLSIFPNPASGDLFFNLPFSENDYEVSLYDIYGNIIVNKIILQSGNNALKINELCSGIYIINIINGSQTSYKIVVISN